ncbi:hypothetical protein ACWD6I_01990 [Streptomyces sp. NPDC002454]
MIRVVRTRTLTALRSALGEAEAATNVAQAAAEQHQTQHRLAADRAALAQKAVADLRAEAARLEGEVTALRAQSLLDTEDRQALRTLLKITRKHSDRVYALFHHGELHSVHTTLAAAEAAAEAEGAARSGWTTHTPGSALPPAREVRWRVQPLPLGHHQ